MTRLDSILTWIMLYRFSVLQKNYNNAWDSLYKIVQKLRDFLVEPFFLREILLMRKHIRYELIGLLGAYLFHDKEEGFL